MVFCLVVPFTTQQGELMIRRLRTRQIIPSLGTILVLLATVVLLSCTPRVEVAVPDKPITINLNVKIDHEIRVKVEKDLENVFTDQSGLF
jgi:hypothetical protein